MARSLVNTSVAQPIDATELARELRTPSNPPDYHLLILLEDAPEEVLAGLVNAGHTDWGTLYRISLTGGLIDDKRKDRLRNLAAGQMM